MTPDVGTELINPLAGTKSVFTATAGSTDGAYVEIEATYPANSQKPPLHLHPAQTEEFEILDGSLRVIRGEESFTVEVVDKFTVAPGTPHQMWARDEGAVMRWRTTPAMRTGELFCEMWKVARDNEWTPSPLQMFEAVSQFPDEFCLC